MDETDLAAADRVLEALLASGRIEAPQRAEVRERLRSGEAGLGPLLVEAYGVDQAALAEVYAEQLDLPLLDLRHYAPDPEVVALVPRALAERYRVLPVAKSCDELWLAMVDPLDRQALESIPRLVGTEIRRFVARGEDIQAGIHRMHATGKRSVIPAASLSSLDEVRGSGGGEEVRGELLGDDPNIVKLVNLMISQAVAGGVSVIHVEPFEKELKVRYRADGILYTAMSPPKRAQAAIADRVKIMAGLDVQERRVSQHGRIRIRVQGRNVALSVVVVPSTWGEKIVLRILSLSGLEVDLEKLGFEAPALRSFQETIGEPSGLILVTGPTGAGKTVTLYSALTSLNRPDVSIMTAEDPVQYQLAGVTQCQARYEIGMSFASLLRTFLASDADVVMVQELRDLETAWRAMEVASTGRLVFSAMHTSDAPSTLGRLLDMGLEPYLVASQLRAVLAQRLARKVCQGCRREVRLTPEERAYFGVDAALLARLGMPGAEPQELVLATGAGCQDCGGSGFRGRTGVFELLRVSEPIRSSVLRGDSLRRVTEVAREEGMITLRESALAKALRGVIPLEEVVRVTPQGR